MNGVGTDIEHYRKQHEADLSTIRLQSRRIVELEGELRLLTTANQKQRNELDRLRGVPSWRILLRLIGITY